MSSLIPYRFRNSLSRPDTSSFLDDFFRPFFMSSGNFPSAFSVDVKDEDDKFVLEADLPGVKREGVNIDLNDGVLTITIPVAEQARARKVEIARGNGDVRAIEATATEGAAEPKETAAAA